MNDATAPPAQKPSDAGPPTDPTFPTDLAIAEWTDCGEYDFGAEPDYVRTAGDAGSAIWSRLDALFGFFGFGALLFATPDGRVGAAEFDLYCRPTGGEGATGEQPAAGSSLPDDLGIADWISPDLLDPDRARTVW